MKPNTTKYILLIVFCLLLTPGIQAQNNNSPHIITNPLNLNYRFQYDDPSYREAADSVLEYFKGKYYMFASKSGGYWSSADLCEWTFIPCQTITTIEAYAPTILVHDNALYYLGSGGEPQIFRNTNPDKDQWEAIDTQFNIGMTDPAFYKDDNGKIYLYWGCSDKDPIMGVQVDPEHGFKPIGEPVVLIEHHTEKYGWEVPGDNNEEDRIGWNEGPCMIKYKGQYYLHYAAPGTQYRIYGDGIYISDKPLGPFTYVESNPFSFKPGGFIGGAGHGHTFKDKYGNYWHIATMKISVRHMFERRLGLFPTFMTENDELHSHTLFTDYPFAIPDRRINMENENLSMGWHLLTCGKPAKASSTLPGYDAAQATDEMVETWWSAQSGQKGEWLEIDMGKQMRVNALQINFADQDFSTKATDINTIPVYQYLITCSKNGIDWQPLVDKQSNREDRVHELIILDKPVDTRFIRITNTKDLAGKFSLSGLRAFGYGNGKAPVAPKELQVNRDPQDKRTIRLTWPEEPGADGYIIRWGTAEDQLMNATQVYGNSFEGRFFNRDSEYFFTIGAFNDSGITEVEKVYGTKTR